MKWDKANVPSTTEQWRLSMQVVDKEKLWPLSDFDKLFDTFQIPSGVCKLFFLWLTPGMKVFPEVC